MNIGYAVDALKWGHRVHREGWNGKGMYLILASHGRADVGFNPRSVTSYNERLNVPVLDHVLMYTAQGEYIPWLCSQADLLATDWGIVDGS